METNLTINYIEYKKKEKMLKVTPHQGTTKQNHTERPPHTDQSVPVGGQSALLLCWDTVCPPKATRGGGVSRFGKHGPSGAARLQRSPGCPEAGPNVAHQRHRGSYRLPSPCRWPRRGVGEGRGKSTDLGYDCTEARPCIFLGVVLASWLLF